MSNLKNSKTKEEGISVIYNKELTGIELYFTSKPNQEVIDSLKYNKFRWNNAKKCWYCKDNTEKREFVKTLTGDYNLKKEVAKDTKKPAKTKEVLNSKSYEVVEFHKKLYVVQDNKNGTITLTLANTIIK